MSQLPLSLGGFHSSATLKPQMSTIFRASGGPGRSAQWQKQQTAVCRYCRSHFSSCAGRPPRVTHLQPAAWHSPSPPRSQSAPAGRTSPSVFSRSCGWRGWCPRRCSSRWQTSCSEARRLCSMSPLAAVYPVWPQGQQVEAHEHSNQATTWRLLNAAECTVNALPDCYHAGPIEKKAADHLQCWKATPETGSQCWLCLRLSWRGSGGGSSAARFWVVLWKETACKLRPQKSIKIRCLT